MGDPGSRRPGEHRDEQASSAGQSVVTVPGSGARCDACHQAIEPHHGEVRCFDASRPVEGTLRFHQWCHYKLIGPNRD